MGIYSGGGVQRPLTSVVFLLYTAVVEKQQHIMMATAIAATQKVAADEHDLNEYIAHEVQNPLAAAMPLFLACFSNQKC